jgi:RNA polymerase sigma-70 factor (ECF subfamily)
MNSELLVKKAKNKDPDAFVKLMDAQKQSLYRVAKAYLKNDYDCADAIQETILACWEKLETLKKEKYFKTWMIRILINKCKDQLKNCQELYLEDAKVNEIFWEEDFSKLEWEELLQAVGEKYREILVLYYSEGFKIREISQLLDMPEATVKTRMRRAKAKLEHEYFADRKGCSII